MKTIAILLILIVASAHARATGDSELREMLAEVASAKACEMIRGQFQPLHAADRPQVVTGVLWVRECAITHDGTRVTYTLAGNGWQWADQTKHEAGGTFVVREYVRFGVRATLRGTIDLAYEPATHVLSFWFLPAGPPDVTFEPIGKVEVDRKGTWSSIVGSLSSVIGNSPDKQGKDGAKKQGTQRFEEQLGHGLTVAVDLCNGYQRFTLGRPKKGSMGPPDVGETPSVPAELQPGSVFVFGPEPAPHGFTAEIEVKDGPALVELACVERADDVAVAFLQGKPTPAGKPLAQQVVRGKAKLHVPAQTCKVAVIARAMIATPVELAWRRPVGERGAAFTGGPMAQCSKSAK